MKWPNPVIAGKLFFRQSLPLSPQTFLIILSMIVSIHTLYPASTGAAEKQIIGWLETVQILPENLSLPAKIDTGADHSSINVINQKEFRKGKEKWIRFSVPIENDQAIRIERRILRTARIKRKGVPPQRRAVVLFDLCVGAIYKQEVPVNLADRRTFKYPMLIGRSFLKETAIVDASVTFSQSPSCPLQ